MHTKVKQLFSYTANISPVFEQRRYPVYLHERKEKAYSYLNASMGLSLAALLAG